MEDLSLACQHLSGVTVITVGGELDLLTAGRLEGFAHTVRRTGDHLVIDLTGVMFMDCCGLSGVLRTYQEICQSSRALWLVAQRGGCPARLLHLTKIDLLLPPCESLDQALVAAMAGSSQPQSGRQHVESA